MSFLVSKTERRLRDLEQTVRRLERENATQAKDLVALEERLQKLEPAKERTDV